MVCVDDGDGGGAGGLAVRKKGKLWPTFDSDSDWSEMIGEVDAPLVGSSLF